MKIQNNNRNRSLALGAALIACASMISPTQAAEFTVDTVHSHVGFLIRHLISKTAGKFNKFDGTFTFDPKKLDTSKADFTIEAASIDTGNEKRDGHLRSEEILNTDKFKTLTFVSKKVTAAGKNKYKLIGDFTLHGVTKPVTFDVEHLGTEKDPQGTVRSGFTATTVINRKDYGIAWNKVLETGKLMVGEDVTIKLEIEGIEKTEKKEEKK